MKDELLVKEILGVQSFSRVKTGEHYSGPNFFEGDKKMHSAGEPEKNPFVFVAAAVSVCGVSADKAARTVGSEHLAYRRLHSGTEFCSGNETKHPLRILFLKVCKSIPLLIL